MISSSPKDFSLSDFDYSLPEKLIAQFPATPRDSSKLLVYNRKTGTITDDYFFNIANYLPENSTLVLNNSKVEKCRLLFDGGAIEIFVTKVVDDNMVEAMVRPGKKFRPGSNIQLTQDIQAKVIDVAEDGIRTLRLAPNFSADVYEQYKHTPFPPYVRRDESLAERYQTVYARAEGSKAAPTAGLHFTERVFQRMREKNIQRADVTLHVGLGTFAPVKAETISEHKMHSEWYQVDHDVDKMLAEANIRIAVGTTSVRVLETIANGKGFGKGGCIGETDIFITPGYRFKMVDALITNFHLPKSTLLMLISAFMGYEQTMQVYEYAINHNYRFYSFGDAMLIL